jgi:hypothetical protein
MNRLLSVVAVMLISILSINTHGAKEEGITESNKIDPISVTDNGDGTSTAVFYLSDSQRNSFITQTPASGVFQDQQFWGEITNYLGTFQFVSRLEIVDTSIGGLSCPSGWVTFPFFPLEIRRGVTTMTDGAGALAFVINKTPAAPIIGDSVFCWDASVSRLGAIMHWGVQGKGKYSCLIDGSLVVDTTKGDPASPQIGIQEFLTTDHFSSGEIPDENKGIVTLRYPTGCL